MVTIPLAVHLRGRRVLVVGGGPVATQKAQALFEVGASVSVVAPEISPELVRRAADVHPRAFVAEDVKGAWLVVAAAPAEVNAEVKRAADARQVFVVAVDDVASCSAFSMARLQRAGVTVAIGTGGQAPALAALVRRALDALLPEDLSDWLAIAQRERVAWKSGGLSLDTRRARLLAAMQDPQSEASP